MIQCFGTMCPAHPFVVEWHLPCLFSLFLFLSIFFPSHNSLITNFFILSIVLFQIDTNLKNEEITNKEQQIFSDTNKTIKETDTKTTPDFLDNIPDTFN